ncbi:hypothetical protein ABMA57_02035 [Saccharospirillum sp. HFRX-1]|uniref:hypothetical protein n=1 Tax=unclassified Saccharospirillum TaxID=2633430 RepID=UPI003713E600
MVAEYLSAGMKVGLAILRFTPNFIGKLWNYWKRPSLQLAVRNTSIEFATSDAKRLRPNFPAIRIHNASSDDVTFDLGSFFINGESLSYIIQQNTYFSRTLEQNNPEHKLTTDNKLIRKFKENWTSSKFLKLPAHEYIDLPLYPQKMGDSTYFKTLDNVKVFFPKRKIVVVMTVNSRESHFAVDRMEFLRIIVNCLVNDRAG